MTNLIVVWKFLFQTWVLNAKVNPENPAELGQKSLE